MPEYVFSSPDGRQTVTVIQRMSEPHRYFRDGLEWGRVWSLPQAAIDTKWDPMDSRDFVEKTGKRRGTIGDLWSKSAELGQKREEIIGKDPVKEKHLEAERKRRGGAKVLPWEAAANRNKVYVV